MTACSVEDCRSPALGQGFCNTHAARVRRFGSPLANKPVRRYGQTACDVEGCNRPHRGLGLCNTHYHRLRAHGMLEPKRKARPPKTCKLRGCKAKHKARGLCSRHYAQQRALETVPKEPMVPVEPIRDLLKSRFRIVGSWQQLAFKLDEDPRALRRLLKQETCMIGTADRIVTKLGHHLSWVYPEVAA